MAQKPGSDGQWEDGRNEFAHLDECGGFQVHDHPNMLDILGYLASLGKEKEKWKRRDSHGT